MLKSVRDAGISLGKGSRIELAGGLGDLVENMNQERGGWREGVLGETTGIGKHPGEELET